jgi:hypothetical protein
LPGRRRHIRQPHQPPFGLAHDLLGDDQHVAFHELFAVGRQPVDDQGGDIVAGLDKWKIGNGKELERNHAILDMLQKRRQVIQALCPRYECT